MQFHEDHIFPRSRFTRSKLTKAGISADKINEYLDKVDTLPNLQLLAGLPNIEKQAKLPVEWLNGPHFPTTEARASYIATNDLDNVPDDLGGFLEFIRQRRTRIEQRLRNELHLPAASGPTDTSTAEADVEADKRVGF
jgi:hypothetical protein